MPVSTILIKLLLPLVMFVFMLGHHFIKPYSRVLFINHWTTASLPWIWMASVVAILCFLPVLRHPALKRSPYTSAMISCLVYGCLLVGSFWALQRATDTETFLFYLLIDVFGVVLMEQLWTIVTMYSSETDDTSYVRWVSCGLLLGACAGTAMVSILVRQSPGVTMYLPLYASLCMFLLLLLLILVRNRAGGPGSQKEFFLFKHLAPDMKDRIDRRPIRKSFIMVVVLFPPIAATFIDYMFLETIANVSPVLADRAVAINDAFFFINVAALTLSLVIAPFLFRSERIHAVLTSTPLLLGALSVGVLLFQLPLLITSLKIFDRSMYYSLYRHARENLYMSLEQKQMMEMKILCDMFLYRFSKVLGALLILWLSGFSDIYGIKVSFFVLCLLWIIMVLLVPRFEAGDDDAGIEVGEAVSPGK